MPLHTRPPMPSLTCKDPVQVSRFSVSLAHAWWIAKWILVLVLAWDQIASPLHQHHHDSGIDASWIGAVNDGASAGMMHVDDGDNPALFAHGGATSGIVWPTERGHTSLCALCRVC